MLRCQVLARSKPILRAHLKRYKRTYFRRLPWIYFKAHPMPYCTFVPESGPVSSRNPEWSGHRYRARNPESTAGGKYQIIDSTWAGNGGTPYGGSHPAAVAPPLEQERVARRVLASQGLGAWVKC